MSTPPGDQTPTLRLESGNGDHLATLILIKILVITICGTDHKKVL